VKCPYPGCWLEDWHEDVHKPRLRLIQRYSWAHSRCEVMALSACSRGRVSVSDPSVRWCRQISVAYYETAEGKGVELCADCEQELLYQGAMELGPQALCAEQSQTREPAA
jgi:hypothetical protein